MANVRTSNILSEDIPYEEEVLRNPYSVKCWLHYLTWKNESGPEDRFVLWERAIKELPGSYKLWFRYLEERRRNVEKYRIDHPAWEQMNNCYERCLANLHKMPRIWLNYLTLLMKQRFIKRTRETFDRALMALPITQHDRIWSPYVRFVKLANVPETAIRVFRRFLKFQKDRVEDFIEYLEDAGYHGEAAKYLVEAVNDPYFESKKGRSKHELWMHLCDIMSEHPEQVSKAGLKVEPIIRTGLGRFEAEVGNLWAALGNYYVRLASFDRARDIFEEGITQVMSIRDFSIIWEGYSQFERGLVMNKMNDLEEREEQGDAVDDQDDLDFTMARYEDLLNRKEVLQSDVLLRQNPHNVHEWHKRIALFEQDPERMVAEYERALKTVDAQRATGKPQTLWIAFARLYEEEDLNSSRKIYQKAVTQAYRTIDNLASIYCEWVEMELRNKQFKEALDILKEATAVPPRHTSIPQTAPVSKRLFRSKRLWALYADIEESVGGSFEGTRSVYDKILDLRLATPRLILNYAQFLEEHSHFEESFKVYERGVSIFKYPNSVDIWMTYLRRFIERYGSTRLERARDLFEQACEAAPVEYAFFIYLLYAELEEEHGLARHAMQIYARACRRLDGEQRFVMYNIYVRRAAEFFGITRTREIFETAIEELKDKYAKEMCMKFARLELRLGEIDRARAVYVYCSQFCPPRTNGKFWQVWDDFEQNHGNTDTYRDHLRVRRSVQAKYSQANITMNPDVLAEPEAMDAIERGDDPTTDMMALLEQNAPSQVVDEPSTTNTDVDGSEFEEDTEMEDAPIVRHTGAENTEEIDIDDDDAFDVEKLAVPQAVFGQIDKDKLKDVTDGAEALGAKDRLKKKRKRTNL